jgi:hypothetical protein
VTRVLLTVLLVSIILLAACGLPSAETITEPVDETSIPVHFITYTDEAGLFSISYPPDWELGLSEIKGITQDLNDYWKGVKPELTVQESTVVFFVGVTYKTGYNPNVSIHFIPSDGGTWKLEDLVEVAVQQGLMKDTQGYQEFSRDKSIVDGKEAIFLEYEVKYPLLGEWHALDMYIKDGRMLIKVASGVMPPKDFSDFETDLYNIVRSLRILE